MSLTRTRPHTTLRRSLRARLCVSYCDTKEILPEVPTKWDSPARRRTIGHKQWFSCFIFHFRFQFLFSFYFLFILFHTCAILIHNLCRYMSTTFVFHQLLNYRPTTITSTMLVHCYGQHESNNHNLVIASTHMWMGYYRRG